jgi:hypothetical protein
VATEPNGRHIQNLKSQMGLLHRGYSSKGPGYDRGLTSRWFGSLHATCFEVEQLTSFEEKLPSRSTSIPRLRLPYRLGYELEDGNATRQATRADPRVTRLGR